ncbi:TPA: Mur ligase domain-containing protein [Serratia marcescens]
MRIHILGICGTFMGGLAMLARSLGHDVTGSDANVYPPMSTLLENQGIDLIQGYDPAQLDPAPDLVIIGNAMTRGTARILAVLEPRSNTMKMGISKNDLAPSLGRADEVFLFQPHHIPWQVAEVADACVQPAHWSADLDTLVDMVVKTAQPGDHILVMSNGGFGGIHDRLLDALAKKQEPKVTY